MPLVGLDVEEAMWEPASVIYHDARQFLLRVLGKMKPNKTLRKTLRETYGWKL